MTLIAMPGILDRSRTLWRDAARGLARLLPRGLYARSLLIVIVPMVLLQSAVAYVFMQRHWDLVTHRLSAAVARDVGALVDLYGGAAQGEDDERFRVIGLARFGMAEVTRLPAGPLPPRVPKTFLSQLDPLTRAVPDEIAKQVHQPFWVDTIGASGLMEIRVDMGTSVLRMVTRKSLAYEPNVHIFILWMLGASIVLLAVAILFLRNQIRPILQLGRVAEDFGKGRDFDYHPHGAREVRQAGYAFIEMRRRVERASEQRTAMLNGVSHDLRTLLTRLKLSLALMEPTPDIEPMQKDVDEMQQMLEGYLSFARGDAGESTSLVNLRDLLEELRSDAERHGARPALETSGDLLVKLRPIAFKRCLANLVANAQRHGDTIKIQALREQRFISINIDDNGPGIALEHREDVFRPFFRLDAARNQDEGGSGLGLAIARDIARSHGGDITLGANPLQGLRANVRIPV